MKKKTYCFHLSDGTFVRYLRKYDCFVRTHNRNLAFYVSSHLLANVFLVGLSVLFKYDTLTVEIYE